MRFATLPACLALALLLPAGFAHTQQTASLDSIKDGLHGLRQLPEAQRGARAGELAHQIAALPASADKVKYAVGLAHLSTEGDPGRENLQAVTDALAQALAETPYPSSNGKPTEPYRELAVLQRYEGMHVTGAATEDAQFTAVTADLAAEDEQAGKLDFTLKDIHGKKWTRSELNGKIVVLNFWATWCPPCRQELPNLDAIAEHYASQGLVVLAVTDEEESKVMPMLRLHNPHFTVLFDSGRKVENQLGINSIPRTLIFDRQGKLAAQAQDARTQHQFLLMLRTAGLQL